jgi:hypothetical protein
LRRWEDEKVGSWEGEKLRRWEVEKVRRWERLLLAFGLGFARLGIHNLIFAFLTIEAK